jgi:LEA14-like dessication related protein
MEGYIGNDRGCWNCYYRFISICMLPLLNPEIKEVEVRFGSEVLKKAALR